MKRGRAYRARLDRRAAARATGPVESPWPRCPECGRVALKQHGDGCWVCAKGHAFRAPGQPGVHVDSA